MSRIVSKYKNVDFQLQSSRKIVRKKIVSVIILILVTIFIPFLVGIKERIIGVACFIVILCIDLLDTDWSINLENNILTVRKWFFTHNIPLEDLIDINKDSFCTDTDALNRTSFCLLIKYKKGDKIRNLRIEYLRKKALSTVEYVKPNEMIEFINIFVHKGELEETNKANNLDVNYKNIRTQREEEELADFLNKKKKSEEKIIWIALIAVIIIPIIFLAIFFSEY